MEGTNKAHENGEAMGFVGVRLTAQLGFQASRGDAHCAKETGCVVARWEAAPPKTGQSMARNARQLGWSRVTSLALVNR